MYALGIDLGSSSIKLILLKDGSIISSWNAPCRGSVTSVLIEGLRGLPVSEDTPISICAANANADVLRNALPSLPFLGIIPAILTGVRHEFSTAGSIIEIGSQSARFIANADEKVPDFSSNEHCAGGTGSFFEDQMTRLGMKIEDYSRILEDASQIPRLSGRCAVFAKTDIIHRQQEGVPTPDILLGLCYAMIRNYKATVVRTLPVKKPIVFTGGVTRNSGVVAAIRDVFSLSDQELLIPREPLYTTAAGCAIKALDEPLFTCSVRELIPALIRRSAAHTKAQCLPSLSSIARPAMQDSLPTGSIPENGCILGVDIGSTSTNLVLIDEEDTLIDFQYLRTAGDPEGAVRKGLQSIRERFGDVSILCVGVTGSGRERIGKMIGADIIRDEITAQARGALQSVPEVDTVFEIGGQDSKYIHLKDGKVNDFQMNKICAAGTGSFVEEQATRMGIPLSDFGSLAVSAESPCQLGERCTVFIETAIASAQAQGASTADLAAGLCHSIVRNYLSKVVGTKPIGEHVVLQGGVAYNPGVVAAFESALGRPITVNPCFGVSGAFGAALLAKEARASGQVLKSTFRGFEFTNALSDQESISPEIQKNIEFYQKPKKMFLEGYTGEIDPKKKTVGIPYVLLIHKFFPMANGFFQSLGFNVILTDPTNEETIRLSQLYAQGETCYPVKLIYGHMQQLIDKKVDYIFLPCIHTIKHENSQVAHNYGCVYMQTAPRMISRALGLKEKGITLLAPEFDLDHGQPAMAASMVGLGKILHVPKPLCAKAVLSGAMAVRKHTQATEEQGKQLLASIKPSDKVLVLITRQYGVSDPILNMGIPEMLLKRGHKVITLSHLPGHDLDISKEYPTLCWPFGQHIISGAKIIAHHPNLYAVYLTNHGCGPDSMMGHLFAQEMGDKPYLQIEVDEHFSKVGVITRIEAFLNSLESREALPLPTNFEIKDVTIHPSGLAQKADAALPLRIPSVGEYTPFITALYRKEYERVQVLAPLTGQSLQLGRKRTNTKEYLPFAALLGEVLACQQNNPGPQQYLIPQNLGAEADSIYAQVIAKTLLSEGYSDAHIISPVLETLPKSASDREGLFLALLAGDVLYAAPASERKRISEQLLESLLTFDALLQMAKVIAASPLTGKKLAATGTPLCLTELDDGILSHLEEEGNTIYRAPLSEYFWMLWKDNDQDDAFLSSCEEKISQLANALGTRSSFSEDLLGLTAIADGILPRFAGGNGRYRFAKAVQLGKTCDAVLVLEPRYENVSMVLDMSGLKDMCPAPVLKIELDHDLDEATLTRLNSFLYYC